MNDTIIDKIKKLRSLSTSNNIFEATNAAMLADKLIHQYRISEAEINDYSSEKPEKDGDILYESARATTWKTNLAMSLSKHYGCFIYNDITYSDKGRAITRLRLVGLKQDMSLVSYMFGWLVFEIERLNQSNKGRGHIFCNSYCLGAVSGIAEQLHIAKKAEKTNAEANNQTQALAKLDARHDQAKEYINSIIKLKNYNKQNNNHIDGNAYDGGVRAGKNIHLGNAIGGRTKLLGS